MSDFWEVRIQDIAEVLVSNVDKKSYAGQKAVVLCNYMDVYSNDYISSDLNFMESTASEAEIKKFSLRKGDVVITKDSESPFDIGIPSVVTEDIDDLVCGYHLAIIRPSLDKVDPLFLAKQLSSEKSTRYFARVAAGSTRFGLSIGSIHALPIQITSLEVQKKIGEIGLTIDNQIDATQALIDKYTAIKQGMMADLFSRGIDPETKALRPTFEEAPELYHKTPLGILPKEWNVKTLGDISEKITSGSRDWAKFYSSEGDLFVRISNLTREHVNFRWNSVKYVNIGGGSEGERTQLQPGDILVSITADLGIVGVVPEDMGRAYINQHTALIRLSTDGENARFIGNYLSSRRGQEQFEKNNDSGAKAGINLPTIASLRCPIPEEKEQILIASKIDALDEVIADLKREKSKSISLKQGLMQDLLTGKVSVPA